MNVDLDQLADWDARIVELAGEYGLDCFPQEFEICDHEDMIGYMAYSGMPSRYPHWSYGKSFERQKTMYDYGVSGLPYEMVINSNPSLAYLMGDNSTCLNVLTIAHVYGHNDFFKNNRMFAHTRPEFTLASFRARADRVRSYIEHPAIGQEKVESILDAAHALSLNCRRNLMIRKTSHADQVDSVMGGDTVIDPWRNLHQRRPEAEPDLHRVPLEPEEDLLLFIRDHNPALADWEKDLLTIVQEEAEYFLPQIETKIINEGWASYWHYQLMTNLPLPEELRIEFMIHHNQVICPHPGGLNPYHIGFRIWEDIYRRVEGDGPPDHRNETEGRRALYEARETQRDSSFLRRFLTDELTRDLGLFEHGQKGNETVVREIADDAGWERIRDTLTESVGMGSIPVIRILDSDTDGRHTMLLEHCYDGRELQLADAEKTLAQIFRLWGRDVTLRTSLNEKNAMLSYDADGFSSATVE